MSQETSQTSQESDRQKPLARVQNPLALGHQNDSLCKRTCMTVDSEATCTRLNAHHT